jgi:uncharacterized phage protein (TIGR01671 family)
MREIKFRAWNNSSKEMEYFTSHKMGLQYRCGEFEVSSGWDSYGNPTYNEDNNNKHEIMEYTGLKDKNGKEIYEGDIYKSSWDTNSIVKWTKKDTREVSGQGGSERVVTAGYVLGFLPDEIEIIGNIHENPELLK